MSRWGRACDDGRDGSFQFLHPRVVDEPDLYEKRQSLVSELGSETGGTCTVGAPQ